MQTDIQKHSKFLIVSDTAVSRGPNGEYLAFEPVAREIESFYPLFESITWIASEYPASDSSYNRREINDAQVNYILTPRVGGPGLLNLLLILREYIRLVFLVRREIKKADFIHSRGPAHAAIICALWSFVYRKDKIYWHKFAGNWNQKNPPKSYGFLRWLLKRADHTSVTINGHWPDQKPNQLTFENPCLTKEEREAGKYFIAQKDYSGKLDFVFVGRLEDEKGVQRILNVFSLLQSERIGTIHFVGDGPKRKSYEHFVNNKHIKNIVFHGYLPRTEINELLSKSHVFLLPSSASEGFPKVIAEAANYGLIPVVSDVSSISQYIIDGKTGFIVRNADEVILQGKILALLDADTIKIKTIAEKAYLMAEDFTYDHYQERILNDILKK